MFSIALAFLLVVATYWYFTRNFGYWEKRGVKHDKPVWLFGNNLSGYLKKKSMTQLAVEMYEKYPNERLVGFYRAFRVELVVRDPEIVKRILTTDFGYFHYRGFAPHKNWAEPMMKNLFFYDGDLWRLLRQRVTPAFTSSKLKAMFPLIVERAQQLLARVLAAGARPLDARDLMARYTTDFIGACGFGLDADSLSQEDSAFRKLGVKMFEVTAWDIVKRLLKEMFPETFKHVKYLSKIEDEVKEMVEYILRERNYQPSARNDFIDLMLECQQKGSMVGESLEKVKADGTPELVSEELTQELNASQVCVFFAAGFETSSSATSYTLHQLAFNPMVQSKVQKEIDRVLAKYDNKLCYEAVKEMKYLECAFKESLRMFPSVGFLYRECARPYTFQDLNFSIDRGVRVLIPLQALHHDPAYFPEPEQFRPERFLSDDFNADKQFVYLPFGEGPRSCIGERLGLMQSLAGLAAVLARCRVQPAPAAPRRPRVDPRSHVVQAVRGGLPLVFRERPPPSKDNDAFAPDIKLK